MAAVSIAEGNGTYSVVGDKASFIKTTAYLEHYFAKKPYHLPLMPAKTPFGQKVQQALLEVPFGQTISYQELARRLGNENASRAVGAACKHNHIPLVVPCHRVIAKNGTLGGFNMGLTNKKALLKLEELLI